MDQMALLQLVSKDVIVPQEFHLEELVTYRNVLSTSLLSAVALAERSYRQQQWATGLNMAQVVVDIAWEKLNTGHWKDVPVVWRTVYSYGSLLKALLMCGESDESQLQDVIHVCDMGLIMGAPILDNILAKLAAAMNHMVGQSSEMTVRKKAKGSHNPIALNEQRLITRLSCPSLEEFRDTYFSNQTPLVVEKAIDHWPAMKSRRWSLDYIKRIAGYRTVPIEVGTRYTDSNWTQEMVTLTEFIDKHVIQVDGPVGYLAQHGLFDQIPELRKDIGVPEYCCLGEKDDVEINAWFGPCGTISPLHFDPKHNWLVQVVGYKYIRLYAEEYTSLLYPYEDTMLANTSQVDVEAPDNTKFPAFASAPYLECVLAPGEMLYIPPRCWHYVRSLAVSFSVSFWWE